MSDPENKPTLVDTVLAAGVNPVNHSVALTLGTPGLKKFELELSLRCAPVLVAVVLGAIGKLLPAIPPDQRPKVQPIIGKSLQLGVSNTTGNPALMITLETGAELAFEFDPEDMSRISQLMSEIASLGDTSTRH